MNKKLNRQIDLLVSGLHVREASGQEERSRVIDGYAVVFDKRSVNLTPWSKYREVYEVIEQGSITDDLLKRSDVVLTAFHDNTCILGRWRMGKGTLGLSVDKRGLHVTCELAETERANELLSAIERGDISGMSFAFTADEEDNENGVAYTKVSDRSADGKEVWLRKVKKINGLYDVTIAGHPAYPQTTVEQREIDDFIDSKVGEPAAVIALREAEAKKKAEEEAERKAEEQKREEERKEHLKRELKRRERKLRMIQMEEENL